MSPRLLAVDLDGTLLDRSGRPHDEDLRALRAARAQGVHVTIVTGRLFSGTREVAHAIGIRGPVACVDGSHVVEVATEATLVHHVLRGESAAALRRSLASAHATFVFAQDRIVHDARGEPYLDYVRAWSHRLQATPSVEACDAWLHEEGITAVVALGEQQDIERAAADVLAGSWGAKALHFSLPSGLWGLMVRAGPGSKGTALAFLAQHAGVSLAETVAVGDWLNDLPLFAAAGRSFVMGHAPDDVKRHATDVLTHTRVTGGGVAHALRTAFGITAR